MKKAVNLALTACIGFMLLINLFSCKEESPSYTLDQLSGFWNIDDAQRNAKSINTLNNGFFIFHPEQGMSTNIMPDDSFVPFSLEQGVITQDGGESLKLKIEKLTPDSLVLNTLIRKDRFIFYLLKSDNPEMSADQ